MEAWTANVPWVAPQLIYALCRRGPFDMSLDMAAREQKIFCVTALYKAYSKSMGNLGGISMHGLFLVSPLPCDNDQVCLE